jgi:hypothetical protein
MFSDILFSTQRFAASLYSNNYCAHENALNTLQLGIPSIQAYVVQQPLFSGHAGCCEYETHTRSVA